MYYSHVNIFKCCNSIHIPSQYTHISLKMRKPCAEDSTQHQHHHLLLPKIWGLRELIIGNR